MVKSEREPCRDRFDGKPEKPATTDLKLYRSKEDIGKNLKMAGLCWTLTQMTFQVHIMHING